MVVVDTAAEDNPVVVRCTVAEDNSVVGFPVEETAANSPVVETVPAD